MDPILTDSTVRQVTGYAMIALVVAGFALSLRKRLKRFAVSDIPALRVLHGLLGAVTLVCLWAHTGLRMGERLNLALTIDFLALIVLGGVTAAVIGAPLDPQETQARRMLAMRAHVALFLPLPALLALHLLGAYYF